MHTHKPMITNSTLLSVVLNLNTFIKIKERTFTSNKQFIKRNWDIIILMLIKH